MDDCNAAIRRAETIAVFLDMDGTLIELASRPDAVHVPEDLGRVLAAAGRRLNGALALISGRMIEDLDRLLSPVRLPASGIHGAEFRLSAEAPVLAAEPLSGMLREAVACAAAAFTGTMVEDKGASLAVHFRARPDVAAPLRAALQAALAPGMELLEGDLVFEIKPTGFDKGSALRRFMDIPPFAGRRPIFVSDHAVDRPGFDAASSLGGFGVSVGQLLPGAACHMANTHAVRSWLRELAA